MHSNHEPHTGKLRLYGTFDAQAVGNVCYGLKGTRSEYPEVRRLVEVLVDKVQSCKEPLDPQAVGNELYGLQRLSSDFPDVC